MTSIRHLPPPLHQLSQEMDLQLFCREIKRFSRLCGLSKVAEPTHRSARFQLSAFKLFDNSTWVEFNWTSTSVEGIKVEHKYSTRQLGLLKRT